MTSNGGGISGSDTDDEIVEVECIEYQSLEDTDDEDEVQEEEEVQVVDDEATSSDESSGSDCVILEDGDNGKSKLTCRDINTLVFLTKSMGTILKI